MFPGSDETESTTTVNTDLFKDAQNNVFFKEHMNNRTFRKVAIEFINGETLPVLVKDMMDDKQFKDLIHKYLAEHKLSDEHRQSMTEQDYCNLFLDCMSLKDFTDLVRENVTEGNFKQITETFMKEKDTTGAGVIGDEVKAKEQQGVEKEKAAEGNEAVNAAEVPEENQIDYLEALSDLREEERDILALAEQATLTQEELDILALAEQASQAAQNQAALSELDSQNQSQEVNVEIVREEEVVSEKMEVVPDSEEESDQEAEEAGKEPGKTRKGQGEEESTKDVAEEREGLTDSDTNITTTLTEVTQGDKQLQDELNGKELDGEVKQTVIRKTLNNDDDDGPVLTNATQIEGSGLNQGNTITVLSGQEALNHWQQDKEGQTPDKSKKTESDLASKVEVNNQNQQSGSSQSDVSNSVQNNSPQPSQNGYRSPTGYGSQTEEESHDEAETTDAILSDECSNGFDPLGGALGIVDPLGGALEDLDLSLFDDALQNLDLSALNSNLKDLDMSSLEGAVHSFDISLRQDVAGNSSTGQFLNCDNCCTIWARVFEQVFYCFNIMHYHLSNGWLVGCFLICRMPL